ncbi:MAG: hypothetical protein HY954_02110 [Deltaproteobacteria bacterium]|nr:hypothetical protein [Deltaproteobacteria bacterium]
MPKSRSLRVLAICLFLAASGCAAAPIAFLPIALPAIIAGAGGGISYTLTNIAFKTMTYPMDEVAIASVKALDKMSMETIRRKDKKYGMEIKTGTRKLTVYITLEEMTPTLTRMEVNAKKGLFFKDKTTAFEIIYQTERFLLGMGPNEPVGVSGFNK